MYKLSFTVPYDYLEPTRALLGVETTELSDDRINTIAILGQAEIDLYGYIPTIKSLIEDLSLEPITKTTIMAAFINLIAYHAFDPLKVSLLASETDNKTTATRFKDALSKDPKEFKAAAIKLITQTGLMTSSYDISLFSTIAPETDIITGNVNVR